MTKICPKCREIAARLHDDAAIRQEEDRDYFMASYERAWATTIRALPAREKAKKRRRK